MKKILSIFSVVLAATAFCPSCTNLESEMYNVINPGIFPKNEEDAKALVTLPLMLLSVRTGIVDCMLLRREVFMSSVI